MGDLLTTFVLAKMAQPIAQPMAQTMTQTMATATVPDIAPQIMKQFAERFMPIEEVVDLTKIDLNDPALQIVPQIMEQFMERFMRVESIPPATSSCETISVFDVSETQASTDFQYELPDEISDDLPEISDLPTASAYFPSELPGDVSDLPGDVSDLPGDVSDLPGDVSELPGDVSNLPEDEVPRKKMRKRKRMHRKRPVFQPEFSWDLERKDPPIRIKKRLRSDGLNVFIEEPLPSAPADLSRYAKALKDWTWQRRFLKVREGAFANPLLVKPQPWNPKTEYEELFASEKLNFNHALIQYAIRARQKLSFRDVWPTLQHFGWKKRLYGTVMVYCAPSGEEFCLQRLVVDLAHLFDYV